ncbi:MULTISPECIES: hypothetical protein [Rhodococcus]|jgi:acyl-CoA synthetase (AMP-forming)/AMP-acid ligase II|uniref:Propionate--CoA ligase n=1 Tax=Rhodococcus opacus RKJ300 = JCM 13270 TaxID=1165867 RepID=I0WTV9_RHOOP|nr:MULTISPECIES: hypothetical protein [Rhodococcus]EID79825.1 propionate--CoA ligase [Rhodococcus opacus RKJ300 = JCM 13270]QQZ19760.1 propionate--CoA ligase [Rhodococcus sp. 21391]WAM19300.1 propionate--CoA ligase [Rhodococcus sp. JS3073]
MYRWFPDASLTVVQALLKTRSGKILRKTMRQIADHEEYRALHHRGRRRPRRAEATVTCAPATGIGRR